MSKNYKLLTTIVVLIILGAAGWYVYASTRTSKQDTAVQKSQFLVVPTDILSDSAVKDVEKFNQNGTLPITVSPSEKGKDNPFASY